MKNNKKLACTALALFASSVCAETPAFNGKGTASVEVRNTLDIVETASLNFGVIAAVAGDNDSVAQLKLAPSTGELTNEGTNPSGSITPIDKTAASPGIFTVSNAAKYADLNITLPKSTQPVALKMENAAPGSLDFVLSDFTATSSDKEIVLTEGAGKAKTDGSGNLVLNVGATLSTVKGTAKEPYLDAVYSGEYAVTISY